MDPSAPEPLSPVPFYGVKSKRRNLNIKRTLENCSKRLKDEKIPSTYHSRLLGPSSRWEIFYRQQEALDFASQKTEDLHVFAFESQQPGKQSGQRQFLTATYDVFWHYYMQLDETQRHHYEVIPEDHPCKLYFDLEFHKPTNPGSDGEMMVDTLIKYVCCWLQELYNVQCSSTDVLKLSASTETKFSRHLVFQIEGNVFRDNVTAGDFLHAIFNLLEDCLCGELECKDESKQEMQKDAIQISEDKAVPVSSSVSGPGRDICGIGDGISENEEPLGGKGAVEFTVNKEMGKKEGVLEPHVPEERKTKEETAGYKSIVPHSHCHRTESAQDFVSCSGEQAECFVSHVSTAKALSPRNKVENKENPPREIDQCEQVHQGSCVGATTIGVCKNHSCDSKNSVCDSLSNKGETLPRPQNVHQQECGNVVLFETTAGGKEEQSALKDTQISKEKMVKVCDAVFMQLQIDELRSLFVKDKEGKDVCFVDLGVYTKNRNFRLYKSCKQGKTTAFTVAESNRFTAHVKKSPDNTHWEKEIFLASLIANVRGDERLLTFGGACQMNCTQPSHKYGKSRTAQLQDTGEHIEGYGKSPYPEVDDFISSQVSSHGGAVRRWSYFPSAEILSYDIVGYRFCHNIQRQHRSNNIKLVADLQKAVWYQKCYDPDCQAINFKSEEFKLPGEILPANYFADYFDDPDDNSMEEDDEVCLLALEEAEQSLTSTTSMD